MVSLLAMVLAACVGDLDPGQLHGWVTGRKSPSRGGRTEGSATQNRQGSACPLGGVRSLKGCLPTGPRAGGIYRVLSAPDPPESAGPMNDVPPFDCTQ